MKDKKNDSLLISKKALQKVKYIFIVLFSLLIVNLIYFIVFSADNLVVNTYNPRLEELEKSISRGEILDSTGEILAQTIENEGKSERVYPYENAFSHVIGYSNQGKTGLEAYADLFLIKSNVNVFKKLQCDITNSKKPGDNVVTTLNASLQVKASELIDGYKGAIIAIEPSTGKILCMVSKPDFNPNDITFNWDKLINDDKNSPLLNRATQGLYPPGSTFKIITALEYLKENPTDNFNYTCTGKQTFDGKVIHCYDSTSHGDEDLKTAFANSCNTAFATIGEGLNINDLNSLATNLLYNKPLPYYMDYSTSSFTLNNKSTVSQIAETVIGQGETMVSPLHSALIVSTIANGGQLMKPYIIDHIESSNGKIIKKYIPQVYDQLIEPEYTETLTDYMIEVVKNGTGVKAASEKFKIAGKTGSAENPFGNAHAWFVGFAPADKPEIAIAIVVENAGSSGATAVPMAKELFEVYLQ